MDRGDMVRVFRTRLIEALDRSGESRSAFAQRAGIDRSTLWHLLSPDNDRLPRAETVATIAAALRVSLDWLLGLSQEEKPGDDILEQTLQLEVGPPDLADERLARWHAEAAGYKVRHVPTTLPDVLKTDEVMVTSTARPRRPRRGGRWANRDRDSPVFACPRPTWKCAARPRPSRASPAAKGYGAT